MKNKLWIILIFFIIIAIGFGVYSFTIKNTNNNNNNNSYTSSKTSTSHQNSNFSNNTENISTQNNITNINNTTNNSSSSDSLVQNTDIPATKTEEVLTSFSTKIYTKDSARQNNINITCSALNETIIANGSTFSFCNTVGQATSDKGYQKADIFDKNGNKKKGLGGGNCQVSTTLYNAVLAIPSLPIIERHEHSNKVPYIQNGKDAAVAYGSYDLKFKNDTGYDIKIKAESNTNNITITLCKMI